jgi:hypothetical protein
MKDMHTGMPDDAIRFAELGKIENSIGQWKERKAW